MCLATHHNNHSRSGTIQACSMPAPHVCSSLWVGINDRKEMRLHFLYSWQVLHLQTFFQSWEDRVAHGTSSFSVSCRGMKRTACWKASSPMLTKAPLQRWPFKNKTTWNAAELRCAAGASANEAPQTGRQLAHWWSHSQIHEVVLGVIAIDSRQLFSERKSLDLHRLEDMSKQVLECAPGSPMFQEKSERSWILNHLEHLSFPLSRANHGRTSVSQASPCCLLDIHVLPFCAPLSHGTKTVFLDKLERMWKHVQLTVCGSGKLLQLSALNCLQRECFM